MDSENTETELLVELIFMLLDIVPNQESFLNYDRFTSLPDFAGSFSDLDVPDPGDAQVLGHEGQGFGRQVGLAVVQRPQR